MWFGLLRYSVSDFEVRDAPRHYYADFFGSLVCGAALCVLEMTNGTSVDRVEWLCWLMIGVGLWTLFEYGIHRGLSWRARLHPVA
jgi:hypothetical protein